MLSTRSLCCRVLLFWSLADCGGLSAPAQPVGAENPPIATATIPESNEALILSSKVEEALTAGDYRLAVELIERLRGLPEGLVVAPAGRTYYPVWRQAFRLLRQLPPEGAALYRQLHDAEVESRFQQAVADADLAVLRELFYTFRLSEIWTEIGDELAAQLLDRGAYEDAIEILREVLEVGGGTPEQRALMAIAQGGAGAWRTADAFLEELRNDPDLAKQPVWDERLAAIERWRRSLRSGDGIDASGEKHEFTPRIEIGAAWAYTIESSALERARDKSRDLVEAIAASRRLPHQNAVATEDGCLVFRMDGYVRAIEASTMVLRWQDPMRAQRLSGGPSGGGGAALSPRVRALMSSHLRSALSAAFGKVFMIEWAPRFESGLSSLSQAPFSPVQPGPNWNELTARSLEDGALIWSTRDDSAHPLYDVMFQNAPIAVEDRLIVPFVRNEALLLAELDPDDGALLGETLLVGPPTEFNNPEVRIRGGRCLIAADPTTLYVCTGHGVVAALSKDGLKWKWAAAYPSTLAERLGRLWWMPAENPIEPNIDPPILADDLLILAPVDSNDIFALDRYDGAERWRISRRQQPYMIGALRTPGRGADDHAFGGETYLVVGGRGVTCLDLHDPAGAPPRWRSAPFQITGRAAIRDTLIYVPTRDGIAVLDGVSGKIVRDQCPDSRRCDLTGESDGLISIERTPAENLLATRDSLYGLSLSRLSKYPDTALLRESCRDEAGEETSVEAALILAWSDALEGSYEGALARLHENLVGVSAFAGVRDSLLRYVFLQLARDADAGQERLDWLHRASELADSPEASGRMAIMIGRVLEESARLPEALRHYGRMLYQDDAAQVVNGRKAASWIYAAERIADLFARGLVEGADELVEEALATRDKRADNLHRLRLALYEHPVCERIEQLLCLQKMPPEIKAACLPVGGAGALPAVVQRRLCLESWDAHASLGLLDRAARDRATWEQRFTPIAPLDEAAEWTHAYEPLTAAGLLDRAAAIDLAIRKLTLSRGNVFTPSLTRQWKIEKAELLLDLRKPLEYSHDWILVANLEHHRIELINAFKHQYPQRQTPDESLAPAAPVGADGEVADLRGRGERRGGRRSAWPVITYGCLAAVPVRGGLIGLGTGPERYAGRRLWDYAVPEWRAAPQDVARLSAAGQEGVYIAPRPNRIALVGWHDGRLWWEREFPGVNIERLALTADQLAIISTDKKVWLVDRKFGRSLRRIEFGAAPPSRIDLIGDTIVAWSADAVVALESRGLTEIWRRRLSAVDDTAVAPDQPWIAYRIADDREWRLLDVRDGRDVIEASLGRFDALDALASDAEKIYVAGRSARPEDEGELLRVTLRAFEQADGELLWRRDFTTGAAINPTQLAAHPAYIPILLTEAGGDDAGEIEYPAILLVEKQQGGMLEPHSISGDYRAQTEASCEMRMLVTPNRMIVQGGGNIIGYGNSPLGAKP